MDKNAKIYVAGYTGLVGSAIWNALISRGYTNLIGRGNSELELLDGAATARFFAEERPEYVLAFGIEAADDCAPIFQSRKKAEKKRGRPRKLSILKKHTIFF